MTANDGTTVVNYASLDLAAADIQRQAKQLGRDLNAIKTMIASVSELWEGEAKTAYQAAQARWDVEAASIQNNLAEISRAVRDAAPAYRSGDKRAAANFL
ncbi:WXG100 family type VII secretion target [Streptomyces sp. cmx-18-6]|uniref:WXG100 family type VII secretion target n=1 Tax=Streptomyces sp. cmx-18-6 TaxID=2790930 RepID=UPI00397F9BF9